LSSPAHSSEAILSSAKAALRRRRYAETHSIGRRSQALKHRHFLGRIWRMILGVMVVILAAMVAGIVIDGIGFTGLFITALAAMLVAALLLRYPRLKVPTQQQLAQGSVGSIVGNTELWLETQRRALPAPAVRLVDHIGMQLDALGIQLQHVDDSVPAATEIRKLVGEHLPDLVSSYTAIPAQLRTEPRAGHTPDEQLADSLGKISAEIDRVTRQLATGAIDDLAIRTRYLDYKYGNGVESEEPTH
jgi:hypothetical protein